MQELSLHLDYSFLHLDYLFLHLPKKICKVDFCLRKSENLINIMLKIIIFLYIC